MKFRVIRFSSCDLLDPLMVKEYRILLTSRDYAYFASLVCNTSGFVLVIDQDNRVVFFCAGSGWSDVYFDNLINLYGFKVPRKREKF